jgi:hypothetical protein
MVGILTALNANQIQNYDGCSDYSQKDEPDTRQLFSREVTK